MPFLTKREKQILLELGVKREFHNVAPLRLQISPKTVDSHLTKIWKKYMDALETMDKYSGVFEGRAGIHRKELEELLRVNRRLLR